MKCPFILDLAFKNTQTVYHLMTYGRINVGKVISAFKVNFGDTDMG